MPKENCDIILKIKETSDPLLTTGKFGKGRTIAYMSDPAPHWGCNFIYWKHYNDFWVKCIDILIQN